jgi:hypothetical protein
LITLFVTTEEAVAILLFVRAVPAPRPEAPAAVLVMARAIRVFGHASARVAGARAETLFIAALTLVAAVTDLSARAVIVRLVDRFVVTGMTVAVVVVFIITVMSAVVPATVVVAVPVVMAAVAVLAAASRP